ncbi:hypothetical protein AHAS_Ahas09G0144000 [Arachis hypogaea]
MSNPTSGDMLQNHKMIKTPSWDITQHHKMIHVIILMVPGHINKSVNNQIKWDSSQSHKMTHIAITTTHMVTRKVKTKEILMIHILFIKRHHHWSVLSINSCKITLQCHKMIHTVMNSTILQVLLERIKIREPSSLEESFNSFMLNCPTSPPSISLENSSSLDFASTQNSLQDPYNSFHTPQNNFTTTHLIPQNYSQPSSLEAAVEDHLQKSREILERQE